MNKVKVLFSGVSSNVGGVETFLLEYIRHMDADQIQFDLLCCTDTPALEEEFCSLGVKIYKVSARSRNPFQSSREIDGFFREHAGEYDIFWCNKCMLNNIDYLKYAKKYGIPVRVIHSHNSALMDVGIKGILMKHLHEAGRKNITRYATVFWACSDFAGKWFYTPEIMDSEQYSFIPNAIDAEKFRFSEEVRKKYRAELGIEDQFVVGHVGRFHLQKNHMFLVDIFYALQKKKPESVLLLIGQGERKAAVEKKVQELGIADKVKFLGVRGDVSALMQAMDCFLLPSLFEGLPVVAVEAQAAGLPCYLAGNGTTRQTKLTDRCEFLQLEDAPEVWADVILAENRKRIDTYEQIVKAGFELKTAAKIHQERLIKLAGS